MYFFLEIFIKFMYVLKWIPAGLQGKFRIAARHHVTTAEIFEKEDANIPKVKSHILFNRKAIGDMFHCTGLSKFLVHTSHNAAGKSFVITIQ